jgi:glutamate formiminotransferase
VPNFSEGRNETTIASIAGVFKTAQNVWLLDVHTDPVHNRSVFTTVGAAPDLAGAVFDAARLALETIDLGSHKGEHPRIGAVDVIPFISLHTTAESVAVGTARSLGKRLGNVLGLPVFLYGTAARGPDPVALPEVRRRGFEWLRDQMARESVPKPDFGPHRMHPTGGATAVGARDFLVAFNVVLDTPDIRIAKAIAREIRTRGGGPPGIRALGFQIGGRVQVSMNLYDLDRTTPRVALNLIKSKAGNARVSVLSSEIVGLMPEKAISDLGSDDDLLLSVPVETRLLEPRLRSLGLMTEPDLSGGD